MAVTVFAAVTSTVHGPEPEPEQSGPLHPVNVESPKGVAVNVTVPLTRALQVVPQSIPPPVTAPEPVPVPVSTVSK